MRWSELLLYFTLAVYLITEWTGRSLTANVLTLATLSIAWLLGRWHTPWIGCEREEDCPVLRRQLEEWESAKQRRRQQAK
jgi:hypothetical protein